MGSSPKRQDAGTHEAELAKQGAAGMDKFDSKYAGIEADLLEESSRDYSDRLGGQGRVGAARAMSQSAQAIGLGNATLNARGMTQANIDGTAAARKMKTERLGNVSSLAAGQQGQNVSSLSSLAQGQAGINRAKHQAKQSVSNAQMNAVGTVVGAGLSAGAASIGGGPDIVGDAQDLNIAKGASKKAPVMTMNVNPYQNNRMRGMS